MVDTRRNDPLRHQSNLSYLVPTGNIVAAQANLTAVNSAEPGFLTAYPCLTSQRPGTSNVNFVASVASANSALLGGSRGYGCIFASTQTQLVLDLFGIWTT